MPIVNLLEEGGFESLEHRILTVRCRLISGILKHRSKLVHQQFRMIDSRCALMNTPSTLSSAHQQNKTPPHKLK